MRVLVANKFWYPRGGLERVMFDEIALLEAAGHQVAHLSTTHPDNDPSPWADYFVPYLELGGGGGLSAGDKLRAAGRMFGNAVAAQHIERLIDDFRPDVVHAHGIHRQLSPSILLAAARRGVPAVESLHDFHHVCPADTLLYQGSTLCLPRRCKTHWYGPCVGGRCVRGSLAASTLSAAEVTFQRLRSAYERSVTRFISPSEYMADRMREGQWHIPIDVVPNAVELGAPREGAGDGFALICRMAPGKGVDVALQAARKAGVRVTVAGTGPLEASLRSQFSDFTFVGHLARPEVVELVRRSRAVLVPSEWPENAPMSILESMAESVPVIASRVGGIPEQVHHGSEGLLVEASDIDGLAAALTQLDASPDLAIRMGQAARATVQARYLAHSHLEGLLATYRSAGGAT